MTHNTGKFVPVFPHAHYHSYAVENGRMVDINPILKQRAEDVFAICRLLGANSVTDVGSNLGGFLFYLEQFGNMSELLGIEGDRRFTNECEKVRELLGSSVRFINNDVMSKFELSKMYDAMIFQNIYHYIYDKEGSHRKIFEKLAEISNAIIWYNPMTTEDPVIVKHANSNPATDWQKYNHQDIFLGAIQAGFLHPVKDTHSKFGGMGNAREHWIFIKDQSNKLNKEFITLSEVSGDPIDVAEHYGGIHSVVMNETRSFKIFTNQHRRLAKGVIQLVNIGVIDADLCPDLRFIIDEAGEVVGYSQPRGAEVNSIMGHDGSLNDIITRINTLRWRLFSRMVRHDVFSHDLGQHNFVINRASQLPMLIDLENFVFDASKSKALSAYKMDPDPNEFRSAKRNLSLVFNDVEIDITNVNSISWLRKALHKSNFLSCDNLRLNL
jgi:hypothetical protein